MRIVVATVYGTIGGSSKMLLAAANALRESHAVIVRAPLRQADSVTPQALPSDSLETKQQKFRVIPKLARAILAEYFWLRKQTPDMLYVHDELSLYVYGVVGRLLRVPVIWHVHMREGRGLSRRLRDSLCSGKIFVSSFMVGSDQHKPWAVIRNSVSAPIRQPKKVSGALTIGMIGSISKIKNQELGVRTVAALREKGISARILIYGDTLDGLYRTRLERLIVSLGLSEIAVLRGFVPLHAALSEIDVLLVCSTYESFGLATVEALGSGIPVVASDIESHREIAAILGTEALTLAPLKPEALAQAILDAKTDDNVPQRVAAQFGEASFSAGIHQFFREQLRLVR